MQKFPEIFGSKDGLILLFKDSGSELEYAQVIEKPLLTSLNISFQDRFESASSLLGGKVGIRTNKRRVGRRLEPITIDIMLKCLPENLIQYDGTELLEVIDVFKGWSVRDLLKGIRQKIKRRETTNQ